MSRSRRHRVLLRSLASRPLLPSTAPDGLFLFSLAVLSTLTYVFGLGFYSDDWNFLGVLATSEDGSLRSLIAQQWELASPHERLRPTQMAYQAVLYSAFGLDPVGYTSPTR